MKTSFSYIVRGFFQSLEFDFTPEESDKVVVVTIKMARKDVWQSKNPS